MGALSPMHWLIIVGVVVLLFGAKRLPDAARSLGRSARILKAEVGQMHEPTPGTPPSPAGLPAGAISHAAAPATAPTADGDHSRAGSTGAGAVDPV